MSKSTASSFRSSRQREGKFDRRDSNQAELSEHGEGEQIARPSAIISYVKLCYAEKSGFYRLIPGIAKSQDRVKDDAEKYQSDAETNGLAEIPRDIKRNYY